MEKTGSKQVETQSFHACNCCANHLSYKNLFSSGFLCVGKNQSNMSFFNQFEILCNNFEYFQCNFKQFFKFNSNLILNMHFLSNELNVFKAKFVCVPVY